MPRRWLPRLWPRSLFGRNLLLLLALTVVVQVSIVTVFMQIQRPRAADLGRMVAAELNTLQATVASIPPEQREASLVLLDRVGQLRLQASPPTSWIEPKPWSLGSDVIDALRQELAPGMELRLRSGPDPQVWVHMTVAGKRYWFTMPGTTLPQEKARTLAVLLSVALAALTLLVAMLIQRRINRPLREISAAASKLSAGTHPERLPAYSATELAAVADQFNAMADSLASMETTRAMMLAGISHDIRTPLTKLRLALALSGREDDGALADYINQIDSIVGQFLDFGRSGADESLSDADLNVLIMQLAGEFENRDHPFELALGALPSLPFRPIAMLRVINNLMENAVKYAGIGLEVRTYLEAGHIHIDVLDRGPGLPADQIAYLLRPFTRADSGRAGVSGTGLGLAIVERLVRLHGGRLQLGSRSGGGLKASVVLPSAPSLFPRSARAANNATP